jgi:hypothetical protein
MTSAQDLVTHRFNKLEESNHEVLNRLNEYSTKQAVIETRLKSIEGLLKWTLGGIFISILGAIGKFIMSGKLIQ